MNSAFVSKLGKVLIVGGGRMGTAIAYGILRIEGMSKNELIIADPGEEKRTQIELELDIKTFAYAQDALPADTIILAVKPNKIAEVATNLANAGIGSSSLIISIAAGISTQKIEAALGMQIPVVRVMPNTPLVCGRGMSAVSGGTYASSQDCEFVRTLFAYMGRAIIVEEDKQDIVCAVSGSGPAYFELFAECIARTAEELGLSYEDAIELTMQTMLGTAELIMKTGQSLPDAIDAVSSPGGTTVAALEAMRSAHVELAISNGVKAAASRSKELGAC